MKRLILIIAFAITCVCVQAQSDHPRTDVLYEFADDKIVAHYANNQVALENLKKTLEGFSAHDKALIEKIIIESYASPEGSRLFNKKLSERRSAAIVEYLKSNFAITDSLLEVHSNGAAWDRLREMVENSDMPHRREILSIIDNVPQETWRKVNPTDRYMTLVDSRIKHLMDLRGGRPYNFMAKNFFPELRNSSTVTIFFKREIPEIIAQLTAVPSLMPVESTPEPDFTIHTPQIELSERVPWFAVKTNLLYDMVLVPNIEVEIPIGNRWSVAAEWMFPWWVTANNGNALQIQGGAIEGRYWFGQRDHRPLLTGWFGGVSVMGGYYDFQRHDNGYQGEYTAFSVIGGYAHTINKKGNLRMEYSLGLGYLSTDYRYYEGRDANAHLVWQHNGSYSWFGPTKAEVSLVWMLNHKRKKKGAVR